MLHCLGYEECHTRCWFYFEQVPQIQSGKTSSIDDIFGAEGGDYGIDNGLLAAFDTIDSRMRCSVSGRMHIMKARFRFLDRLRDCG